MESEERILFHAELHALTSLNLAAAPAGSEEARPLEQAAAVAFDFRRQLPLPDDADMRRSALVRTIAYGVLGRRDACARDLAASALQIPIPSQAEGWRRRLWGTIAHCFWLLVACGRRREHLGEVLDLVAGLRREQDRLEPIYLGEAAEKVAAALELVSLYHAAKAMEIMAIAMGGDRSQERDESLRRHLDRAVEALDASADGAVTMRLLAAACIRILGSDIEPQGKPGDQR
jgi:hypothetical protein